MKEKEELRVKISADLMIKLRVIRIKKGKGAYSEITEKALREFFERNQQELEEVYKSIA